MENTLSANDILSNLSEIDKVLLINIAERLNQTSVKSDTLSEFMYTGKKPYNQEIKFDNSTQELERYQLVNACESVTELQEAIMKMANENDMIKGRNRQFPAKEMAASVSLVVAKGFPANLLTREYGIRQQALYLQHYQKLEKISSNEA